MKKLIFGIVVLAAGYLLADTQTTGNMKLLQPSLTQVDPNRNWGDKFNANFEIIDSTLTRVQNQITAISTTTANQANIRNTTGTWTAGQYFTWIDVSSCTGCGGGSGVVAATDTLQGLNSIYQAAWTWTAAQSFSSGTFTSTLSVTGQSFSVGGNDYIWQSTAPEIGNNILQRSGSRVFWGGDNAGGGGAGGAATVQGATMTFTFDIASVFVATIGPCAVPKACYSMGIDSGTMVGYWMDAALASTNTFTGFKIVTTTGATSGIGVQGVPIQDRFNNTTISLDTATSNGRGDGFSGFVSTSIPFNAGETFSLWITTVPSTGSLPRGVKFHFDMWFKSRY